MTVSYETCPTSAPFFGFMGVTAALCFANIGAAYGTAKSGVGISSMGVSLDFPFKNFENNLKFNLVNV